MKILLRSMVSIFFFIIQFNFMLDLEFVMKFYQSSAAAKTPILFMYGQMEGNPRDYQEVTCKRVSFQSFFFRFISCTFNNVISLNLFCFINCAFNKLIFQLLLKKFTLCEIRFQEKFKDYLTM